MDLTTRVNLVKSHSKTKESKLLVSVVADFASINRTSIYYNGTPISDEELECKRIIDCIHTDNPTWGARQMSSQLKQRGFKVGRHKARRYVDEMGINPVYPKEWFEPIEMEFEGELFSVPKGYDGILSRLYGNYMTPPPVEQQVRHHFFHAYYKNI